MGRRCWEDDGRRTHSRQSLLVRFSAVGMKLYYRDGIGWRTSLGHISRSQRLCSYLGPCQVPSVPAFSPVITDLFSRSSRSNVVPSELEKSEAFYLKNQSHFKDYLGGAVQLLGEAL